MAEMAVDRANAVGADSGANFSLENRFHQLDGARVRHRPKHFEKREADHDVLVEIEMGHFGDREQFSRRQRNLRQHLQPLAEFVMGLA